MGDIHKKSLNVTIPLDLFEWLEGMVKEHEFSSWSHGVVLALSRLKKERQGELPPR
jgi:Arc/MetJ-type ribon-helix-helix transcriptional regulator